MHIHSPLSICKSQKYMYSEILQTVSVIQHKEDYTDGIRRKNKERILRLFDTHQKLTVILLLINIWSSTKSTQNQNGPTLKYRRRSLTVMYPLLSPSKFLNRLTYMLISSLVKLMGTLDAPLPRSSPISLLRKVRALLNSSCLCVYTSYNWVQFLCIRTTFKIEEYTMK